MRRVRTAAESKRLHVPPLAVIMQLDAVEEFRETFRRPRMYRHDPRCCESLREALEVFEGIADALTGIAPTYHDNRWPHDRGHQRI